MPPWTLHASLRLQLWESLERFDPGLAARIARVAAQAGMRPHEELPVLLIEALYRREAATRGCAEGPPPGEETPHAADALDPARPAAPRAGGAAALHPCPGARVVSRARQPVFE